MALKPSLANQEVRVWGLWCDCWGSITAWGRTRKGVSACTPHSTERETEATG